MQKTLPIFGADLRKERRRRGVRKEAGKEGGEGGEHHRGVGEQEQVSPACSRREGEGRGRGRFVEMEKHSFSQKEEGREEAFNDGQNKRSTNLLDRQTIF